MEFPGVIKNKSCGISRIVELHVEFLGVEALFCLEYFQG